MDNLEISTVKPPVRVTLVYRNHKNNLCSIAINSITGEWSYTGTRQAEKHYIPDLAKIYRLNIATLFNDGNIPKQKKLDEAKYNVLTYIDSIAEKLIPAKARYCALLFDQMILKQKKE